MNQSRATLLPCCEGVVVAAMTNEQLKVLLATALEIAADAPAKPSKGTVYISSALIGRLRTTLEDIGIDWRKFKTERDTIVRAHFEQLAKGNSNA